MNAVSIAVESAGTTLLKALVEQIKQLPKPWQQTTEKEQEVIIFRLRQAVEVSVQNVVKRIAAGNFQHIPAQVKAVTFEDGVKATLLLAKADAHALADRSGGGTAIVVLANAAEFTEGLEQVKADADQAQLFQGEEPQPEPVVPSESWQELIESIEKGPPEEGAEPPAPKTMGQQVQEILAKVDVHVQAVVCETWSEQECTVAAYWAIEFAKNPETAPARPHWLPLPCAIPPGHTRVYHSAMALSAYVDVSPEIYAAVQEAWGDKDGSPGYDDFVRAVEEAKGGDDQQQDAAA